MTRLRNRKLVGWRGKLKRMRVKTYVAMVAVWWCQLGYWTLNVHVSCVRLKFKDIN